eukprot:5301645-Amphidinium_carterae.1
MTAARRAKVQETEAGCRRNGETLKFLTGTATQEAAGADRGRELELEAHEAASAVEQDEYIDDVCGTLLNSELVRKTRQLELDWIKSREVYKYL